MPSEQETQFTVGEGCLGVAQSGINGCHASEEAPEVVAGGSAAPTKRRRSEAQLRHMEKLRQIRAAKTAARDAEKERAWAEKLKPRPCNFPPCGKMFTPKRVQDWKSTFCCSDHQTAFWTEANRLSSGALRAGNLGSLAPESEFRVGVSHSEQVLAILLRRAGEWVGDLPKLLPGVNMNVISKLRQAGWNIEAREVGERPFSVSHEYRPNWRRFLPGGRVEYQYRLVKGEGAK